MTVKKRLLIASAVVCGASFFLSNQAHAAEWTPRDPQKIHQDIQAVQATKGKYTVKAGDTLSEIALAAKETVAQLQAANQIQNPNVICVGQELTLNASDAPAVQTVNVQQASPQAKAPVHAKPTAPSTPATPQTARQTPAARPTTPQAKVATATPVPATAPVGTGTNAAKEEIARRESGGSYDARNGQYIGRYQLTASYLNGDYSPANQERVADQYVAGRYGSWENALAFWNSHGWY